MTSCRETARWVNVLGRDVFCGAVTVGDGAVGETGSAETRYARPCRPVKPLLMICEVKQMWAAQRAQRMKEEWEVRGKLLLLLLLF